jgi:hypothetical protein
LSQGADAAPSPSTSESKRAGRHAVPLRFRRSVVPLDVWPEPWESIFGASRPAEARHVQHVADPWFLDLHGMSVPSARIALVRVSQDRQTDGLGQG